MNPRKAGTFVTHVQVLRESGTPQKRVYEVVVIESGESLNRRYYPEATLQQAVRLFDGKAVHAFRFSDKDLNHLPEMLREQTPLGGPLGNKIGTLRKPRWCRERKAILAELHVPVNASTQWFIDMADSALALGEPHFGFSIDGQGEAFPRKVRGKVVEWVERLSDIFSLDAVSNPAAGGRLLAQAIVENVVGDPTQTLSRYEKSVLNGESWYFKGRYPRAKRSPIRFSKNFYEGAMMNLRRSREKAERVVRKLIRTLSGESEPRAQGVLKSLRLAESLSRAGSVADVNLDRMKRQLASIESPSRKVRSALKQLASARGQALASPHLWEQEQNPEPFDLVSELMELLEFDAAEAAQEVFSTLKKAQEFSEAGGSVELNVKELLLKLERVEEPSREVRKAIKLLKEELKRMSALPDDEPVSPEEELETDFDLTPEETPRRLPPLQETFRRSPGERKSARSLGAGQSHQHDAARLRRDLMQQEHRERLLGALSEAEGNGLPKIVAEELFHELADKKISERALRRKINERIREANALVESVKPDFSDLGTSPEPVSQKSPIETTIFEAR